jgi:hypothetical protein
MIAETTTDLLVYRDQTKMFRGRIGTSQDALDENAHTVQWSAMDYRSMLGRRLVSPGNLTYTSQDQIDIAWNLISVAQGGSGGPWGITLGRQGRGIVRTIAFNSGAYVEPSITDMSNLDNGFDWEIDANLKFNSWLVPTRNIYTGLGRGQSVGLVLRYGDNVRKVTRTVDTTKFANVVRYSGSVTAGSVTKDIETEVLYTGAFGPQGRWESSVSNPDLTDVNAVSGAALAELTRNAILLPSYQLTLTRGWWDPTQLWLGDLVTVNIHRGRLNESWQARVSQIGLTVGDEANEENIVVTVGALLGNMLTRVKSNEKVLYKSIRTGA